MQHSLYRILSVTALAWKLAVPAETEAVVNGASITDVGCRIVQTAHGLRGGQRDAIAGPQAPLLTGRPNCQWRRQDHGGPSPARVAGSRYSTSCEWLASSNSSR